MTFRDYYQELKKQERPPHPAKAFALKIASVTGRTLKTVNQWAYGVQSPPRDVRIVIGETLGEDPDVLFPTE
ncbi:MAG: hypothetical protein HDS35_07575 [Bacteroides sp.]|nr:hypothetical protein [Bacteroides sp.]